jgi:hypothetical protein
VSEDRWKQRWAPPDWARDFGINEGICGMCEHLQEGTGLTCKAFPKGIPQAVLRGEVDHREPVEGDHGTRFKRREGV